MLYSSEEISEYWHKSEARLMISRREFFAGKWLKMPTAGLKGETDTGEGYFASFSTCYALLAEIPMEELLETAAARGITTDNKSKLDVVRELYSTAPASRKNV